MSQLAAEWMWLGLIFMIIILLVVWGVLDYHLHNAKERTHVAEEHLRSVLYAISQSDLSTGVCCCGDNMEGHDPGYNCGHSPLDMFDYYGLPVIRAAEQYLEQIKSDE